MNDPNGLIYFKGEYHLFFQHNPNSSVWGPMHWGHAVSKDLIEWEELDIALYPDELGTIFSGSAVVDWENTSGFFPEEPGLVAIFTHHKDGVDGGPAIQVQSLAYSHDKGRTWTKYKDNPVLRHETKEDFRDPKVFWSKEMNRWFMSLATGQAVSFYSSKDLIDWTFESEFGEGVGSHDGVWECPDLFKLKVGDSSEEKWVLFVSIGDDPTLKKGSRTQYFVGDFDGTTFTPDHEDIRWLDFGRDNYAGVSFSDVPKSDGRRIYLGWMSNWRYANEVPTEGWRSQMTLPRELGLREVDGKHKVIQKPVEEIKSYFKVKEEIDTVISDGQKKFNVNDAYLEMVLNIKNNGATQFGLEIAHTADQSTTITCDTADNALTLKRAQSGKVDFSEMFSDDQKLLLINNMNEIKLRIIIDSSSIEIFVNDGEYALTSLIYPDKVCDSVSLFAKNGDIELKDSYIMIPNK